MAHRSLADLETALDHLRAAPADAGIIELIVKRPAVDDRLAVTEAELDVTLGLVGDNWKTRGHSRTPDGAAHPEAQITIMGARVADLVALTRERWALAGDQLYVDMDLSGANLPPGTRLTAGSAELEICRLPHTGCEKFVNRFGVDAMKFVNSPVGRALNLRGIYARVVRGGVVHTGDRLRKHPQVTDA